MCVVLSPPCFYVFKNNGRFHVCMVVYDCVYVYSTPPPFTTPRISYLGRWWSSPWGDRPWWVPPHQPPAWTELWEGSVWCSPPLLCIPDQGLPPDWPPKKDTRMNCEVFREEYTLKHHLPVDAFAPPPFLFAQFTYVHIDKLLKYAKLRTVQKSSKFESMWKTVHYKSSPLPPLQMHLLSIIHHSITLPLPILRPLTPSPLWLFSNNTDPV